MRQSSLRTPLGVLAAGLVIILVLLRVEPQQTASSQSYGEPTVGATADPYAAPAAPTASAPGQVQPTAAPAQVQPTAAPAQVQPTVAMPTLPTATLRLPTQTATTVTPSLTPTPTALICAPNETVYIAGTAPARAALLLYFNERAVGGGSAEPSGRFAIPLKVGEEKAGQYTIEVRVRSSMQLVLQTQCTVPIMPTPAPTP